MTGSVHTVNGTHRSPGGRDYRVPLVLVSRCKHSDLTVIMLECACSDCEADDDPFFGVCFVNVEASIAYADSLVSSALNQALFSADTTALYPWDRVCKDLLGLLAQIEDEELLRDLSKALRAWLSAAMLDNPPAAMS